MKIWAPIESVVSFFKNTLKKFGKKKDNEFDGRSTVVLSEEEKEAHLNRVQIDQIKKINDENFKHNPFEEITINKIKDNLAKKSKKKWQKVV